MKKLTRSIAWVMVAVAGILVPALVGPARADVIWKDLGGVPPNNSVRCEVKTRQANGNPMCPPQSQTFPNNGGIQTAFGECMTNWPTMAVVWRAQYNFAAGANEIAPTVWSFGGATAGGLSTESAVPADSMMGGLGLYTPGSNPPPDSTLSVGVNKSVSTQLTLTINKGGIQVNGMGVNKSAKVDYTIGIYPNETTAEADVNFTGAGAVPGGFGKVHLQAGPQIGFAFTPSGFFTAGDWILQQHIIGGSPVQNYTVRPNGTITKVIPLPGGVTATSAVIYVRGDPPTQAFAGVTPSYSPFGLVLLALGLLGSGFWVIRSRQRPATA